MTIHRSHLTSIASYLIASTFLLGAVLNGCSSSDPAPASNSGATAGTFSSGLGGSVSTTGGSAPMPNPGASGSTTGGSTTATSGTAKPGAACKADADCVAGWTCDLAVPKGECTKTCTADADCGSGGEVCAADGTCRKSCDATTACKRHGWVCGTGDKPFCVPPPSTGGTGGTSSSGGTSSGGTDSGGTGGTGGTIDNAAGMPGQGGA